MPTRKTWDVHMSLMGWGDVPQSPSVTFLIDPVQVGEDLINQPGPACSWYGSAIVPSCGVRGSPLGTVLWAERLASSWRNGLSYLCSWCLLDTSISFSVFKMTRGDGAGAGKPLVIMSLQFSFLSSDAEAMRSQWPPPPLWSRQSPNSIQKVILLILHISWLLGELNFG